MSVVPEVGVLDALYVAALKRDAHDQAALLERAIEQAQNNTPAMPVPVEAAIWYAAHLGLRVFPLQPGKKIPYGGSSGCKDATIATATIAQWWGVAPQSNIGVATGAPFDVVDIDGPEGARTTVAALRRDYPPRWDVRAVSQTPRGLHLWVPAVTGAHNAAYADGIDYRAEGGYVVAPPSHVDGTVYRWLLPPVL